MTPQLSLFRQEAIEFQRHNQQWGHVALLQPLSTKVMTWLIATAVTLVIIFLFLGQYARKETVVGYLTPTAGTSKLFVPQQGTIKEIYVKEGQQVQEGQPLLTVETSQIATNGQDVNATILDTLVSQKALLGKQIVAEQERGQSEHERLTAAILGLENEIVQLQAQIDTQSERVRILEEFVTAATELRAKAYMADIEFKHRRLALLEQRHGKLEQERAAKQRLDEECEHLAQLVRLG